MIVADLYRMGKAIRDVGLPFYEVIEQVSDIKKDQAKNFLSRILVIEIDRSSGASNFAGWPIMQFGRYEELPKKKKGDFIPNHKQAVAVPVTIPGRGNPRKPQGYYGVPVYPIYDGDFGDFAESADAALKYLEGRTTRTEQCDLGSAEMGYVANWLHEVSKTSYSDWKQSSAKVLGILVIAIIDDQSNYRYVDHAFHRSDFVELGHSHLHDGKVVYADLARMVENIWIAKLKEGNTLGTLSSEDAVCSFCRQKGVDVVSIYSKSWAWYSSTWSAPLSLFLEKNEQVEGIAACADCYQALTYGSQQLDALTALLPSQVVKELFAPAASLRARESKREMETVYGSVYVLPVLSSSFQDVIQLDDYVVGLKAMPTKKDHLSGGELLLNNLFGLEIAVPEQLHNNDLYRITALYYTGDVGRGDIHLYAVIEDVVPSVAKAVDRIIKDKLRIVWNDIYRHWGMEPKYTPRYLQSLLVLLANAYGSSYVWQTLNKILHRQKLSLALFYRNSALRLAELVKNYTKNTFEIQNQVVYIQVLLGFLDHYNHDVLGNQMDEEDQSLRSWMELNQMMMAEDIKNIVFDSVAELAYGVGYVTGEFSRQYYAATGKDFIEKKVITFGSNLTPEVVWQRSLGRLQEYAKQLNMKLKEHREQQIGVIQTAYLQFQEKGLIAENRDEFMTAFWSGFTLSKKAKEE